MLAASDPTRRKSLTHPVSPQLIQIKNRTSSVREQLEARRQVKPVAETEISSFRKALDIAQGRAAPEPLVQPEPVVNAALERFAKISS